MRLSDEEISLEGVKILCCELLQRVKNMVETARPELFHKEYGRCREDFEDLSHDGLSDLEPALKRREHMVSEVEC